MNSGGSAESQRPEQEEISCARSRFVRSLPEFSPAGPGSGVGRRGGGRGSVWDHATQGACADLDHGRASNELRPVPHGEGAQAEGSYPGASGYPSTGPWEKGVRLHPSVPLHLQGLHLHQHPHWAAVSEVRFYRLVLTESMRVLSAGV